jgi:hypothetical protein
MDIMRHDVARCGRRDVESTREPTNDNIAIRNGADQAIVFTNS